MNAVYADLCCGQSAGSFAEGGHAASGRTIEANDAAAYQLAALHPGLVRVVERKYRSGPDRLEVICYWKRAFNFDRNTLI